MAKVLNTTVHLTDDKGEAHVFKAGDKLPAWAEKSLAESWPADRDDLWSTEAAKEDDEAPAPRPADKKDPSK
jgi:hypothetical protein